MANILPEQERRALLRRHVTGLLLTAGMLSCMVASLGALAFSPAYLAARAEKDAVMLAQARTNEKQQEDRRAAAEVKKRAAFLQKVAAEGDVPGAVAQVLLEKPQTVLIRSLAYTRKGSVGSVVVQGSATDRRALQAYAQTLEATELVKEVVLPLAAFAATEDGSFTMTITGSF